MQLLILLSEVPKLRLVTAILASVISGMATVAALICILQSLRSTELLWWQFICFAALAVVSRIYARLITEKSDGDRHSAHATADDQVGSAYAVGGIRANWRGETAGGFHEDLSSIGAAVRNFVHLFSAAAFLLACLAYLAWLSPERAVVMAFCYFSPSGLPSCCASWREGMDARARSALDRIVHVFQDGARRRQADEAQSHA